MGQIYDLERERWKRQGRPVPPGMFTRSEFERGCHALAALTLTHGRMGEPLNPPEPSWPVRAWLAIRRMVAWAFSWWKPS